MRRQTRPLDPAIQEALVREREGQVILDRVQELLRTAGLELKGTDGPPVDLHHGKAQLLGFCLKLRGHQLQFILGEGAREKLIQNIEKAHEEPDPPRMARAIVYGWIESHRPAFATKREIARTVNEIQQIGATLGFRELGSTEGLRERCSTDDLRERCSTAHLHWTAYREGAIKRREADMDIQRECGGSDCHHLTGWSIS